MASLYDQAKLDAVFAALTPANKEAHKAAFGRVEAHILGLTRRGAKVFEIHHSVIYGRSHYLKHLAEGHSAWYCEREVMRMYDTGDGK